MKARRLTLFAWLLVACASHERPPQDETLPSTPMPPADGIAQSPPELIWDDVPPAPEAAGVGVLEVNGRRDLTAQLDLAGLSITVAPQGSMALFEAEHRFANPTDQVLEGTFRFPLPDGAVVTGLAMEIDGRLMEGEVLDRDKARTIYESIVDQMRDPALLEWEGGRAMKLRVFPIEPQSTKRVVIRYFAPLARVRDPGGPTWQVVVPTSAPALQGTIGHLTVKVDHRIVMDEHGVVAHGSVRTALPGYEVPVVEQEADSYGHFTAVRLVPDWAGVPAVDDIPRSRRLAVVVDTSRSTLESWPLARQSLEVALRDLGSEDEFCVLASDLTVRSHAPGFVPATDEQIDAAITFIEGIEPDGASDLHRAFAEVGTRLGGVDKDRASAVLYLGDGVATWGETSTAKLVDHARAMLVDTPLFAVLLGRDETGEVLERLAGATGGRVARPDTLVGVEWFLRFMAIAPKLKRLRDVTLEVRGGEHEVVPLAAKTIFEGQIPTVYIATPFKAAPPEQLVLRGRTDRGLVEQVIDTTAAVPTSGVRKRWAAAHIGRLQLDKARKAEVVALSEVHGVLSRYTAFLVLESEEAYREHDIERRRAAESAEGAPSVTGADLGETSLRPGDIQPGDPEILIPAPADARHVIVVFPFGETQVARWDPTTQTWIVRFLIEANVEPGIYEVDVRVTLADGSVESRKAKYTVDTRAPTLQLRLQAMQGGAYYMRAKQIVTPDDRERERMGGVDTSLPATIDPDSFDAARVEAQMPDGQTIVLTRHTEGVFVGKWRPTSNVEWPAEIELVAIDRALNAARIVQTVSPEPL